MYRHRPDILSLSFGLYFVWLALAVLLRPDDPTSVGLEAIVGGLAVAAGVGIIGSLVSGDVHRGAARRLAARGATAALAAPAVPPAPPVDPTLDDLLLDPPIDPEALEREYRERFGDDDPAA